MDCNYNHWLTIDYSIRFIIFRNILYFYYYSRDWQTII